MWADYWDLNLRLAGPRSPGLEAFARWPGSYVEDRLRNDWLLQAGPAARTGATFAVDHPRSG